MNLDQAVKNIDQVIATAPMTRYDHDELKGNLAFLVARARLADGPKDDGTTYKVKAVCQNCNYVQTLRAKKGQPRPNKWVCENCGCETDESITGTPTEESN